MFFLAGVARYLFVPLAEAVVFAMLSSYVLSRTLVPTLVMYFMRNQPHQHGHAHGEAKGFFGRFQQGFEEGFAQFRDSYGGWLESCLRMRWKFIGIFFALCVASLLLLTLVGQDFFPTVDAASSPSHAGRTATRIEETARVADLVEQTIRKDNPTRSKSRASLDNLGLPYTSINIPTVTTGPSGPLTPKSWCRSMTTG